MGPDLPDRMGTAPRVSQRTNLRAVFAGFTGEQLAERLAGFDEMLAQLPADDDTMRPSVQTLRDAVEAELATREGEA